MQTARFCTFPPKGEKYNINPFKLYVVYLENTRLGYFIIGGYDESTVHFCHDNFISFLLTGY